MILMMMTMTMADSRLQTAAVIRDQPRPPEGAKTTASRQPRQVNNTAQQVLLMYMNTITWLKTNVTADIGKNHFINLFKAVYRERVLH